FLYKLVHIAIERKRPQPEVIRTDLVLLGKLIAAFADRIVAGSESNNPDLRGAIRNRLRLGHQTAGRLELAGKPLHIVVIIVRPLAVLRLLVVSAAACKVGGCRMIRSGQGAVWNGIAIHIFIARKSAQPPEILSGKELAALQRLFGIDKR